MVKRTQPISFQVLAVDNRKRDQEKDNKMSLQKSLRQIIGFQPRSKTVIDKFQILSNSFKTNYLLIPR